MNSNEMLQHVVKAGFQHPEDVIHIFQGGSYQHGAFMPNTVSDVDICGVYIEKPMKALGVTEETHFTDSTQDQYVKNRPGDEDYKLYTLRRWAQLACKGNPTILGYLYTPCTIANSMWEEFIACNVPHFQAKSHAAAFLGYAKGQIARLDGTSGKGKHGQRPELEQKFGYDTKAAMHLMRLLFEAEEYMTHYTITYPRPEKELLLSIRQGAWGWGKLFTEYALAEQRVNEAMEKSTLPERVNRETISNLVATAYIQHWTDKGELDSIL